MAGESGYYKEISEEKRLQNTLASCDEQIKREPGNQWWINFRQYAQERLEEIYLADHWDDVSDLRLCEEAGTGL